MSTKTNARPKVLFVDDSLTMRRTAAEYLGEAYEVVTVCDGEEALRALRGHDDIRAVISDLTLPRCDGRELLHALRSSDDDYLSRMPVIIVTGTRSSDMASKLTKAGAHGVMTKPYKPEALVRRTQQLLDFNRRAQPIRVAQAPTVDAPTEGPLDSLLDVLGDDSAAVDAAGSAATEFEAVVSDEHEAVVEEPEAEVPSGLQCVEPPDSANVTAESTGFDSIDDTSTLLPGMEISAAGLQDRLSQAVALHVRHDLPMVVVKLDVLNFSEVSTNASDTASIQAFMLGRLSEALREEDSAGPYSDDTFLVVLPMTTEAGGVVVLNRLQEVFEEQPFAPELALEIRATLCHSELAQLDLESLDAVGRRFAETDQAFEEVMISTPVTAEAA